MIEKLHRVFVGRTMEFLIGGTAACCAGVFTNPLEVVKTRLQLQGELQSRGIYKIYYRNAFHAFYVIFKADGILALQKGLVPALWYQLFMNGVRLGTFDVIQKLGFTSRGNEVDFTRSVAAGAVAGCMGAFIGSPFYMIKTQLQAQSQSTVAVGYQHKHAGMVKAFKTIWLEHGLTALWRGASGALARVTCGSASQLATFSKSKSLIENLEWFEKNSFLSTFAASILSGCVVVVCMTPLDVVSTRLYNQGVDSRGKGLMYTGVFDCIRKMFVSEGVFSFYKGASASLLRTGPHTVLCLTFWDQLRKLYKNFSS